MKQTMPRATHGGTYTHDGAALTPDAVPPAATPAEASASPSTPSRAPSRSARPAPKKTGKTAKSRK